MSYLHCEAFDSAPDTAPPTASPASGTRSELSPGEDRRYTALHPLARTTEPASTTVRHCARYGTGSDAAAHGARDKTLITTRQTPSTPGTSVGIAFASPPRTGENRLN